MSGEAETASAAIDELDRLRNFLKKSRTKQVRSQDERTQAKATASAWFNGHRSRIASTMGGMLPAADALYRDILNASDRATARSTYMSKLKALRTILMELRSAALTMTTAAKPTTDQPPDFSPLIADLQMREIIQDRWRECVRCIEGDVPLAATVMMGGLLETLLLGRINRETNQAPIYKAASAPKDKAGKTRPMSEWGLKDYISVAHELKWITISAKEVAEVLRDFRNYIHPHKQHSHGVKLNKDDATLFWGISKSISLQVLKSCTP